MTCPISCKGNEGFCETVTCCAEVRAIALFEALGGLDKLFLGEQATTNARAKEASSKHNITGRSAGPRGTGYGTGSTASFHLRGLRGGRARGRGRGRGRGGAHNITSSSSRTATEQMASHWDELLVRAMTTITSFLPSPYAEEFKEYDILPHGSIAPLLSLAQLPELLGNLLRNDSVTDWINRSEVYSTMLGLLRRMADCELSIQV